MDELQTVGQLRALVEKDEKRAWDLFGARFYHRLTCCAWKLTEDMADAEDVAQEAIVRWFRVFSRDSGSLDDARPIFPWLLRTCRNCWIDLLRARGGLTKGEDTWETEAAVPDQTDRLLLQFNQHECVQQRSPQERRLLEEATRGMSVRDLERTTGVSRGAISRLLLDLKSALRACLERHGWTDVESRRVLSHG